MSNYTRIHTHKFIILTLLLCAVLGLNIGFGDTKPWQNITWVDIFGEGSATGLTLLFIIFILASRPKGKTTNFLFIGLCCFCAASLQDVLDEIFIVDPIYVFDDIIESIITPIGICIIAMGFYQWHDEQKAINEQLRRKERFYREHSALDYITGLYTSLYMEQQLQKELRYANLHCIDASIIMIDIDQFDQFNRAYGELEGDRLLKQVADIIIMNIRSQDLACRYSADRFIILLPETQQDDAHKLAQELKLALESLAFKPNQRSKSVYSNITYSYLTCNGQETLTEVLQKANAKLDIAKALKRKHQNQAA